MELQKLHAADRFCYYPEMPQALNIITALKPLPDLTEVFGFKTKHTYWNVKLWGCKLNGFTQAGKTLLSSVTLLVFAFSSTYRCTEI